MQKLTPDDLYSLEAYSKLRPEFRERVMEHKKHRRVEIGDHVTLLFEDRLTIQYQVQEMLRTERIFEEADILEELDTYNSLIPDGSNWKATMLIEYPDETERRTALEMLVGVENVVWVQVEGEDRVTAVADEDLERSTETKTSAVHFLRFELTPAMIEALKNGASASAGVDHANYASGAQIPPVKQESLIADLD
jgi:hypothetical protein